MDAVNISVWINLVRVEGVQLARLSLLQCQYGSLIDDRTVARVCLCLLLLDSHPCVS